MTEKTQRETAKIYQFPVKGRTLKASPQTGNRKVVELPVRLAAVEFGSGWYHDAAMQQDAEPARRR